MTSSSLVECSTVVRPAVMDDADAITKVHLLGRGTDHGEPLAEDSPSLRERIGSPGFSLLCAELDNQVIGFMLIGPCVYPDPHPATISELRMMFVDPGHPRCGVEMLLHDGAVRVWQAAAVESARLWVWECDQRAKTFYSRLGWQPDGVYRPDNPRLGEHRMIGYRLAVPLIG